MKLKRNETLQPTVVTMAIHVSLRHTARSFSVVKSLSFNFSFSSTRTFMQRTITVIRLYNTTIFMLLFVYFLTDSVIAVFLFCEFALILKLIGLRLRTF